MSYLTGHVPWGPREALLGISGLAVAVAASTGLLLLFLRVVGAEGTPVWTVLVSTAFLQAAMVALAGALGPRRWRVSFGALLGPRVLPTGKLWGWGAVALCASIAAGAIFTTLAAQLSDRLVPPPLPEALDLKGNPFLKKPEWQGLGTDIGFYTTIREREKTDPARALAARNPGPRAFTREAFAALARALHTTLPAPLCPCSDTQGAAAQLAWTSRCGSGTRGRAWSPPSGWTPTRTPGSCWARLSAS